MEQKINEQINMKEWNEESLLIMNKQKMLPKIYIHTHTHTHIPAYTTGLIYTHPRTQAHTYTHSHIHTHAYTNAHKRTQT